MCRLDYIHHNELNEMIEEQNILSDGLVAEIKKLQTQMCVAKKVFDDMAEGIVITDKQANIQWVNNAFENITGYTLEEVLGKNPSILRSERHNQGFYKKMWQELLENENWQGEIWNRRKDGETYQEWLNISSVKDDKGETIQYVAVFNDKAENLLKEEHMKSQVYEDPLTGLPNRSLSKDRLGIALANAQRKKQMVAVVMLDLDRFKRINDTLGHAIGDQLLQAVAKRIKGCIDEEDTVGRLGGDEFIIIIENIKKENIQKIVATVHKIIHSFDQVFLLNDYEVYVTPSIGISIYPSDGDTMETLIKNAEVAMYRVKEKGRNNYQLYTYTMNEKALERLELEKDMRKALKNEEFLLHYQPQLDIHTGEITGVEALVRWKHPKFGIVSPGMFIPIAEETGFIVPLGEWVLREACRQSKSWKEKGLGNIPISVNLSTLQFKQKNLIETITQILEETDMNPKNLELEITETNAMLDPDLTIDTLKRLKEMGIKIAIDDFGTGYSSLAYFKSFPIHKIKIDRSFIMDVTNDTNDKAIVMAIIGIAKSLGLKSIAEGVETEEQLKYLKENLCDQMQGYYFSRPVNASEFENIVNKMQ